MKLNPMSPKIAATAILFATTGALLSVTPAQAAGESAPAPIIETVNKYNLSSFEAPVFKEPKVVSWAVAYDPSKTQTTQELSPAEKALLNEDAELAQKQKTISVAEATGLRAEQARLAAIAAAEKAAAEKAEAERVAAEKAAAEKAAAEKAAAEKLAAEQKAEAERVAAQQVAAEQAAAAAQYTTPTYAQGYAQTTTPAAAGTNIASQSSVTPAPATAQASSSIGAALVASAYQQIGVHQDCTAMVEKALRSVGKSVGDLAPTDFYRYGTVVTGAPQPGDLMIQPGHVAIFVGNGMAISGGFDGYDTVLHPVSYLKGAVYVRVNP